MKPTAALAWLWLALAAGSVPALAQAPAAPKLNITTDSLPGGAVGVRYEASLSARSGTPPLVWTLASGLLPIGLVLGLDGSLTGTPLAAGRFSFTIRVTDITFDSDSKGFTITVSAPPPTIATGATLPAGTVGTAYSTTLSATGGTPPYSWSVTTGSLPQGLTLGSTAGVISGTPTAAGTASFTVGVRDTNSLTASAGFSLTINPAPLQITTSSWPGGTVGIAYSPSLAATGGSGTYTWSITSGNLPQGLNLAATGAISGTP